jgi:TetR/AcrR family transcriptional regulator, ethionamide resistance regulator
MPPRSASHRPRRRSARKGDLTEQAILDTAAALLADRSMASIGIDELAAGAGISRPSFYFYFDSREAVLRALAARTSDELYRSAEVWLRRSDESPADAMRRAIEANLAVWRRHGPVLRATVHARDTDREMQGFWDGVGRRFVDATAEQIERERAAGLALPAPPSARSLARVLVAMNQRAFHEASLRRRSSAADRELVDTVCDVWLRAIYLPD